MEDFGIVMEELKEDKSPKGKLGNILKLVDVITEKNKYHYADSDGGLVRVILADDVKQLIRFTFVVAYSELGAAMVEQHTNEALDLKEKANLYASTIAVGPLTLMTGLTPNEIGEIMNEGDNDE
jgi:hypothetical protein